MALLRLLTATALLWRCGGGPPTTLAQPIREQAFQVNLNGLRLLEHVLRHEQAWRLVLKEHVKGITVPPEINQRFARVLQPGGDGGDAIVETGETAEDTVYNPRAVLMNVVPHHSLVGSVVAFGVHVLHRAITCLAMRHLSFQAHYLSLLLARQTEPALVLAELSAFRGAVVRVADKLAVAPAQEELDAVLDVYWDVMALMQEDAVHHVRPKMIPQRDHETANFVYHRLGAYVQDHCALPYRADRQLFDDAGIEIPNDLVLDDVLGALVSADELVTLGRRHAAFLEHQFQDLGAETIPRALWTQLFYHARRVSPSDPLDRVNPFITRQPRADLLLPKAPSIVVNNVEIEPVAT